MTMQMLTSRSALAAVLTLSACSWSMQEVPSPLPAHGPIQCTDDSMAPPGDVVLAVFSFGFSLFAVPTAAAGAPGAAVGVATAGIAGGVVSTVSAVHGFRVSRRCHSAREQLAATDAREHEQRAQANARERDEQAHWLTNTAIEAAGSGECATALGLAQTIRWLRPELYERVFVHQAVIVKCLADALAPPP